jgi:tRNA pseudouridine(38-40) synthase
MKELIESLASPNTALSEEQLREVRTQLVQYRLDADMLARFRSNLKKLEGTHSFHNFTSSKTVQISNDSQVKRFMMDISCEEPFLHTCEDGTTVEWIKVSLLGQSFLLNQIRKMIGLVVDATRGAVPESMFEQCFDSKNKVCQVHFTSGAAVLILLFLG